MRFGSKGNDQYGIELLTTGCNMTTGFVTGYTEREEGGGNRSLDRGQYQGGPH
jgi:hypothetical protein